MYNSIKKIKIYNMYKKNKNISIHRQKLHAKNITVKILGMFKYKKNDNEI